MTTPTAQTFVMASSDTVTVHCRVAKTWEEVEEYANAAVTCIRPNFSNNEHAKASWNIDVPRPIYLLLDIMSGLNVPMGTIASSRKGYIRLLPMGFAYLSDYFGLDRANDELKRDVFKIVVGLLNAPILVGSDKYGGIPVMWFGPVIVSPVYKYQINPIHLGSMWYFLPPSKGKAYSSMLAQEMLDTYPIAQPEDE